MKQLILTNEEVGSLCKAMAHLIHAGVSTGDAFALLKEDEKDPACREMLENMSLRADDGVPMATVFEETGSFPSYVCTLLEVGERVGKTEEALLALSRYCEGRARMNRRLKEAVLYPSVLLAVLLIVVFILLVWVLPVFNDVYAQLGSSLTGVAGGMLIVGQILGQCMPVLCVLLFLAAFFGVCVLLRPELKKGLYSFAVKKWGDKGVFNKINVARLVQSLSMSVSSGLTAQEAMVLSISLAEESPEFRKRCDGCLNNMEDGSSLSSALRSSNLLPPAECRLLAAGERSGSSEKILEDISGRLLEESEEALENTVGKVEPTMIVVSCVLVGAILLSVMLPLMNIMTAIG